MKQPVDDSTELWPINECPLGFPQPNLAHSKGKPDVSSTKNINVRFAKPATWEIPIEVVETDPDIEWRDSVEDTTEVKTHPPTRYQVIVSGVPNGR